LYEAAEQLNSVPVLVGFLLVIVLKEEKSSFEENRGSRKKPFSFAAPRASG
jgi:hypothetical protein